MHTVSIIPENSPGLESILCAERAVHTSAGVCVCAHARVCTPRCPFLGEQEEQADPSSLPQRPPRPENPIYCYSHNA